VLPSRGVRDAGRRWAFILLAAAAVFVASAATVSLAGVPLFERRFYETLTTAVPNALVFRRVTRLGSVSVLLPVSVFLIVLLPRQFLRRWWVWVVVMIAVTALEGLGKVSIGRSRPGGMRLGFPSGHTAAAAAFYPMACYFFEGVVRRWLKYALYALAAVLIVLVGLSRMVLRVHWPLDVVGGAALGLAVFAAAAWWHERYPMEDAVPAAVPPPWRVWIYRWQNVLPSALLPVLFVIPPLALSGTPFDRGLDVAGGACMVTGLALRLWAAGHRDTPSAVPARPPTRLATTGPYALMRHPLPLANLLTGVGVALIAENALALIVVPAALIVMYRITVALEDAWLAERFGRAYVDYCARVPALPRIALPTFAAVWSAVGSIGSMSWRRDVRSLIAMAATLALAVLAEMSERLPHLLR
jgi:protein-S-isoprenylcysteine O-methyltransferase Ste14/membrane-associated phospholipid phosphatase